MKTVDVTFLAEQNKLSGSKAIEEDKVYKRYPWPITEIVDAGNFKVEGHAEDHFSLNDWFIITTRKFSTKFRVTGTPSFASGVTNIPSAAHSLGTAQDVGGFVAKRYDVSRQVLKIGTISQRFEGQTLNSFRTGAATIEMNDRAYLNLYDEANQDGVFFQRSWSDTISVSTPGASTTVFTLVTGGLTTNKLRGYTLQLLSGPYEGKAYPIIANAAGTVTIQGVVSNAISGDEVLLALENLFYGEILAGFKGAL